MTLKFWHGRWIKDWRLIGSGRAHSFPTAEVNAGLVDSESDARRMRRQEEAALQLLKKQEGEIEEKKAREETEILMLVAWLASEHYRRLYQELSDSIADAQRAVRYAYGRALNDEQAARTALEEVRGNAVLLSDGRRVYFTRDGNRLYAEDGQQITDERVVREAGNLHRIDSSTYEDYLDKINAARRAAEKVQQLGDALLKLDEIGDRIKTGKLSEEDLAKARRETQEIIEALPAEAREEYERLTAARQNDRSLSYRTADPAFTSIPELHQDFQRASERMSSNLQTAAAPAESENSARPQAYRSSPAF